jgi:tetratricopeptide (TPR) repeat protein
VAWARARLARMLCSAGDLAAAERALAPAVAVVPDHLEVLLAQGLLASAREDWAAAIGAYERARAVSPRHEALIALADLYRATGRERERAGVVATIEALGGDTPGTPDADLQMARFWCDEARNVEAAVRRAEAARAARPSPAADDALAWCWYRAGRLEEAAPLAQAAVARRPNDAAMRFHADVIAAARDRAAELRAPARQEAGGLLGGKRAGEQEPL